MNQTSKYMYIKQYYLLEKLKKLLIFIPYYTTLSSLLFIFTLSNILTFCIIFHLSYSLLYS